MLTLFFRKPPMSRNGTPMEWKVNSVTFPTLRPGKHNRDSIVMVIYDRMGDEHGNPVPIDILCRYDLYGGLNAALEAVDGPRRGRAKRR